MHRVPGRSGTLDLRAERTLHRESREIGEMNLPDPISTERTLHRESREIGKMNLPDPIARVFQFRGSFASDLPTSEA